MPPKGKKDKAAAVRTAQPRRPTPTPVVVIHGGPASNLLDLYLTTPDQVFTLSRGTLNFPSQHKQYDRLPFHPDDELITLNTTGKTITPARLAAINAFYLPYEDLVEARSQREVEEGWMGLAGGRAGLEAPFSPLTAPP